MDQLVDKSYCAEADVVRAMGVAAAETNVTQTMILSAITSASQEIDNFTHTKYHSVEDSGTADSGSTTTTLIDATKSSTWTTDLYANYVLWIYGGTGSGQYSRITSNTTTVLTLTDTLATAPDDTSTYRILPDVMISDALDGNGLSTLFIQPYPIKSLVYLEIDGVEVTTTKVYIYSKTGKLHLHSELGPEQTYFKETHPQSVVIKYIVGMYPVPRDIVRLTAVAAAMQCLITQIGGTYNDVTSYTIPHFTASKGEPYTNIRETLHRLKQERDMTLIRIRKYPSVV